MKKIRIAAFVLALLFVLGTAVAAANTVASLKGETAHKEKTLYNGVTHAEINTSASTATYNKQHINIVTFDLKQRDLYLETAYNNDVAIVNGGSTVTKIIDYYNKTRTGKTAIAAVNGDMWMVTYAHARVEGSGTTYQGYSDAVVKKSLTVSRSFNIVDGEIYTTSQIPQETPYAGVPWAFCITDDFVPNLGQPYADIQMTDNTLSKTVKVDGINRLPANNAIIMYTDRLMSSTNGFALDDAYEMLIEFDSDYKMCHGANVTGTLKAIYTSEDSTNPPKLNNKQMVITVRGNKISSVKTFKVGDKINFKVQIHDTLGNDDIWQRAQHSIGGNIVYAKDGAFVGNGIESGYPTTMLGFDRDGKIVMLTMDGRGYGGVGASTARYQQLIKDLKLYDAFILDGGGSMTMVVSDGTSYKPVSTPIDSKGTAYRSVNNALILAYGPQRCEQGKFELDNTVVTMDDPSNVTFPTEAHVKNFVAGPNETAIGWEDQCLKLTVANKQNDDPYAAFSYLSADKLLSASEYKYITLVYKIPESNSTNRYYTELFCQCENRGPEGGQSVGGYTTRSGKFEYITLYAGGLSKWKGNITGLRIDYFSGIVGTMKNGDYMLIHNIILSKTKDDGEKKGKNIADQLNDPNYVPPVTTDPEVGDINGDGDINNKDVVLLFRFLSGGSEEGLFKKAMDFNKDGYVNNKDVTVLFRFVSGAK